ncbi:MAG: lipoate--protein ligase family protein [Nitrospira sp.]|nr:lipoate--protein ligase family protein [Nitrospira sp.]
MTLDANRSKEKPLKYRGVGDRVARPVRLLDVTLPSPVENLALDEVLLDEMEEHGGHPVLRFWESDRHFAVLGRASILAEDINLTACEQDGIPILRRASGGGTVLQGPGCLSYAFVLPLSFHPDLRDIRSTNRFVLQRIADALQRWEPAIAFHGISDLGVAGLKISGNAQRRNRKGLLFHGTVLCDMRADLIARYLKEPRRRPDYRGDRLHGEFLGRIDASPQEVKQAIAAAWCAQVHLEDWPRSRMPSTIAKVVERSFPQRADLSSSSEGGRGS